MLGGCGDCGGGGASPPSPAASDSASAPTASVSAPEPEAAPEPEPSSAPRPDLAPALTEAQADAIVALEATKVELLAPGAEPRRTLRYSAKAGARSRLRLEYDVAMVQSSRDEDTSSRPVPGLSLDVTVSRTTKGFGLKVEGARATPVGDAEKLLAEEVAPLLESLSGKSGAVEFSARGIGAGSPSRPKGLELEALQIWSSLDETARDLTPPLPEEPVGRGARWRASYRLRRAGLPLVRTLEVELADGEGTVLAVVLREQPIAGKADDPLMPEGMSVVARGGGATGRGSLHLDSSAMPIEADLSLDSVTDITIAGPPGGAPLETTLRLRQTVRVRPRP